MQAAASQFVSGLEKGHLRPVGEDRYGKHYGSQVAAFSGQCAYELRDSWILDNGKNAHVSNTRERFETFTLIEGKSFKTGDSYTQIVGYDTTYAIRTDDRCQDLGPDKLYGMLGSMTSRSSICAFWLA